MRTFYKLTRATLIAVYVLVMVGGIVRSTGSGMGCPDWPKCFGQWVPPTSVEQLPANYKEVYADHRQKKNERFIKYLQAFGFTETAHKLQNDPGIQEEGDFNPQKTLIEYMNRLVGVTVGFLIFAVFVASWKCRKTNRSLTVVAFLTFVLVGFQGWIGSVVVSTNLTPWVITLHMLLALVIVLMLEWLLHVSDDPKMPVSPPQGLSLVNGLVVVCMVTLLVQIVLGTQVREAIDRVAVLIAERDNWIANLGLDFIIHRSFSWAVVIAHALLVVKIWKTGSVNRFTLSVILLILGTIFTGLGMAWFAVPPFLQPVHLTLATLAFGVQFLMLLRLNDKRNSVLN